MGVTNIQIVNTVVVDGFNFVDQIFENGVMKFKHWKKMEETPNLFNVLPLEAKNIDEAINLVKA